MQTGHLLMCVHFIYLFISLKQNSLKTFQPFKLKRNASCYLIWRNYPLSFENTLCLTLSVCTHVLRFRERSAEGSEEAG